jgi:hypothetical protein
VAGLSLAACGSGAQQGADEPAGHYPVQVVRATFPTSQSLAQQSQLVIAVRNSGTQEIPNIAVTITDPRLGTSAQAFAYRLSSPSLPELAYPSRPTWIVDQGPGPIGGNLPCPPVAAGEVSQNYYNNYSNCSGGPGGGVTAYANTWALGPLKPGGVAIFHWKLTAVHAGTALVHYRIAAGLTGKAVAVTAAGKPPQGTFVVRIHGQPQEAYVNNAGRVVTLPPR